MKTTGLEAVLSALRGDSGLTGADKAELGANPGFTAAFDEAARAAAQSSPASRPGTANSNPASPGRDAASGGKSLPNTGRELPADPASQGPQTSSAEAGTADAAAVPGAETLAAAAFAPDETLTSNPLRPGLEQTVAGVARAATGPATIPASANVAGAVAATDSGTDADAFPGGAGRGVQTQTLTNAPGNAASDNAGFAAAVRGALGANQATTDPNSRAIPNAEVARGVTPGQAGGAVLPGTTNTTASAVPTASAGAASGNPVATNPLPTNTIANGVRTEDAPITNNPVTAAARREGGLFTSAPTTGAGEAPRAPIANSPITNNPLATAARIEGGPITSAATTDAGEGPRAQIANSPLTNNPVATAARSEGGPITSAATTEAGEGPRAPIANSPLTNNPVATAARTESGPITSAQTAEAGEAPRAPIANSPITKNPIAAAARTEGGPLTSAATTDAGEAPRAPITNSSLTNNPVATAGRTEGGSLTSAPAAAAPPAASVPSTQGTMAGEAPQATAAVTETMAQRAARLAAGLRPSANAQGTAAVTQDGPHQGVPVSGAALQNGQGMTNAVVPEPRITMTTPEPGAQPELNSRAVDAPASAATGLASAPTRTDTGTSPSVMQLPDIRQAPQGNEFPQEILARVRMIQNQGGNEARLNLHPAELGRLQIAITSEGEATRVAFVVENAQAKEALEQAMPRLREFLQQAGLQLTDSSVAQQDFRDSSGFADGDDTNQQNGSTLLADSDDDQDAPEAASSTDPDRIVDAYV